MNLVPPRTKTGRSTDVSVKRPGERRSISRSATRALDVLEYFGEVRRPLRAVEISRVLFMHPSTTDQLLKTMVESAHLVFDAKTKTYLPSPRLIRFGNWIAETFGADERLLELVKDVQRRTGLITTLTTPNDLYMQIIDLALPEHQRTERGLKVAVFGSAIGSAYLASLDDAGVERLTHRARMADADMAAIWSAITAIRRDGFADGPPPDGGMWSIATALPTGPGIALVLGIAGPTDSVQNDVERLKAEMRIAVDRWISRSEDH